MTLAMSVESLRRRFLASSAPGSGAATRLLADSEPSSMIRVQQAPAHDLRAIYSVRYEAHRAGVGSFIDNFDEFLSALNEPGDVEFFTISHGVERWVFLMRHTKPASFVYIRSS